MPNASDRPVFRFAPSPNGDLHLGHALSAILNDEMARTAGGRFLVRIEDIDGSRARPEFEARILEDLDWLELDFERPVRRQSEHLDDYRAALDRLEAMGLVYPSFVTRAEMKAMVAEAEERGQTWLRDPDGAPLVPRLLMSEEEAATRIAAGEPHALRLDMDEALTRIPAQARSFAELDEGGNPHEKPCHPADWGDVVLARKDAPASYHLAVVVDDAAQGVTHVVRGLDLKRSTEVHRVLQDLLGLPAPRYHHHRLILGPDGRKLSKSEASTSLRALREGGATPADIRRTIGVD
ncbi:Glutamate-tRNA ligase [Hartmannibacter diazotrophicus]|uniref:Glutamate-tRNA ligase n=1 Tax=Hartmannibacter diazotrophicus TaxID=1482074 RepID=A0A2C9DCC6_9HYPH|nr:tRNA glutamyl-Q(34) synthetase GluQRS [Hartmannibacter diazotrophicus]SON57957.1 Glutamate-tRNA ligase [Hartmannibacter diazotrophicus]